MNQKKSHFIAMDLTGGDIKVVVAELHDAENLEIIFKDTYKLEGISSGLVTDLKMAEDSIIKVVLDVEKNFGYHIKRILVSLTGNKVEFSNIIVNSLIPSKQIFKQDIAKLDTKALAAINHNEMELIHSFPLEYKTDGRDVVVNPEGLFATELECEYGVITVNNRLLLNLANCFTKCQIEIQGFLLSLYSIAIAEMTEQEMEVGAFIIEMGSGVTNFGYIKANKIYYYDNVQIGFNHITNDISKAFGIGHRAANKVRLLHGDLEPNNQDRQIEISKDHANGQEAIHLTGGQLQNVIEARVEEIFDLVNLKLQNCNTEIQINNRGVLVGDGASLKGLSTFASKFFHKSFRVQKKDQNSKSYNVATGMIISHIEHLRSTNKLPTMGKGRFNQVVEWCKELFV